MIHSVRQPCAPANPRLILFCCYPRLMLAQVQPAELLQGVKAMGAPLQKSVPAANGSAKSANGATSEFHVKGVATGLHVPAPKGLPRPPLKVPHSICASCGSIASAPSVLHIACAVVLSSTRKPSRPFGLSEKPRLRLALLCCS